VIFDYPIPQSERIHGPAGYATPESFRPWLRDEFLFRCVFCLKRETWGQVTGEFEIDHFEPQAIVPERRVDYENLVYSCRRCNAVKGNLEIEDPWKWLRSDKLEIRQDGTVHSDFPEVQRLILQMDLNSPRLIQWRLMYQRIVELAATHDPRLYVRLTGFPDDLPDLSQRRPPHNSRPSGVRRSCFMRRQHGELPAVY
jgi:hypothetical protein